MNAARIGHTGADVMYKPQQTKVQILITCKQSIIQKIEERSNAVAIIVGERKRENCGLISILIANKLLTNVLCARNVLIIHKICHIIKEVT